MGQLMYVLQFTGNATPQEGSSTVFKATTSAHSSTITTSIGRNGVCGSINPAEGSDAKFESTVQFLNQENFQESGSIEFGQGNKLLFSTVGRGLVRPSQEPGVQQGAVIWEVQSGTGEFEGASGFITSNFTLDQNGAVEDNQLGILYIK